MKSNHKEEGRYLVIQYITCVCDIFSGTNDKMREGGQLVTRRGLIPKTKVETNKNKNQDCIPEIFVLFIKVLFSKNSFLFVV